MDQRRQYIRAASRVGLPRRLPLSTELWERLPLDIWERILRLVREYRQRNWNLLRPLRMRYAPTRVPWAARQEWATRGYMSMMSELEVPGSGNPVAIVTTNRTQTHVYDRFAMHMLIGRLRQAADAYEDLVFGRTPP